MGQSDIRQMAHSAQLCLHYSHCSSKSSHETQVKPAANCVFAGELLSVYTVYMCRLLCVDVGFFLHMQKASAVVSIYLLRVTQSAYHTPCV